MSSPTPRTTDLSGPWRAAALSGELHRSGADPDLDDSSWATVQVPGHWGSQESFAESSGPILYRRSFEHEGPAGNERVWLQLDGVLAQSDVWLDGSYVGDTIGYFVPHRFEITDACRLRTEHSLAVEVSCPDQPSEGSDAESEAKRDKRSLTGSLQTGPLAPPGSPGGIWQPVRTVTTGPVAIRHSRLLCTAANAEHAELSVRLVLDAKEAGEVRIDTSVTGPAGVAAGGGTQTHTVAGGENRIEWSVPIGDPKLWWPASMGEQPLYEVAVAVRTDDGTGSSELTTSDRKHWRTGLRTVEMDNLVWRVNGERLFVKGVSLGPQSRFLGALSAEQIERDIRSARDAGLDMVRVHGHVARPELYAEANRAGLLLWQDLPLVGGYATSTRKAARFIAREAVDLLGHHPSVAVWCGHDEPNGAPLPKPRGASEPLQAVGRTLGRHIMPSWNRTMLDPLLRRELRTGDETRPVITRSGSLPFLTEQSGSDTHLWLGWRTGAHEDLAEVLRSWPRLGAFLGGFGSQSVPISDWAGEEPSWATAETGSFERYLHRQAYADGESWAAATQAYQADLIRSQIETMRRLKYRPSGGFCLMALADAEADGGFGVLDHKRNPKAAYDALVDACRPVIVVADAPPSITTPGSEMALAVHAVSDLRTRVDRVTVTARATCRDWQHEQKWEGALAPDRCDFIGTLSFTVPEINGVLVIDVELRDHEQGGRAATNRYQTVVIPAAEAGASPSLVR